MSEQGTATATSAAPEGTVLSTADTVEGSATVTSPPRPRLQKHRPPPIACTRRLPELTAPHCPAPSEEPFSPKLSTRHRWPYSALHQAPAAAPEPSPSPSSSAPPAHLSPSQQRSVGYDAHVPSVHRLSLDRIVEMETMARLENGRNRNNNGPQFVAFIPEAQDRWEASSMPKSKSETSHSPHSPKSLVASMHPSVNSECPSPQSPALGAWRCMHLSTHRPNTDMDGRAPQCAPQQQHQRREELQGKEGRRGKGQQQQQQLQQQQVQHLQHLQQLQQQQKQQHDQEHQYHQCQQRQQQYHTCHPAPQTHYGVMHVMPQSPVVPHMKTPPPDKAPMSSYARPTPPPVSQQHPLQLMCDGFQAVPPAPPPAYITSIEQLLASAQQLHPLPHSPAFQQQQQQQQLQQLQQQHQHQQHVQLHIQQQQQLEHQLQLQEQQMQLQQHQQRQLQLHQHLHEGGSRYLSPSSPKMLSGQGSPKSATRSRRPSFAVPESSAIEIEDWRLKGTTDRRPSLVSSLSNPSPKSSRIPSRRPSFVSQTGSQHSSRGTNSRRPSFSAGGPQKYRESHSGTNSRRPSVVSQAGSDEFQKSRYIFPSDMPKGKRKRWIQNYERDPTSDETNKEQSSDEDDDKQDDDYTGKTKESTARWRYQEKISLECKNEREEPPPKEELDKTVPLTELQDQFSRWRVDMKSDTKSKKRNQEVRMPLSETKDKDSSGQWQKKMEKGADCSAPANSDIPERYHQKQRTPISISSVDIQRIHPPDHPAQLPQYFSGAQHQHHPPPSTTPPSHPQHLPEYSRGAPHQHHDSSCTTTPSHLSQPLFATPSPYMHQTRPPYSVVNDPHLMRNAHASMGDGLELSLDPQAQPSYGESVPPCEGPLGPVYYVPVHVVDGAMYPSFRPPLRVDYQPSPHAQRTLVPQAVQQRQLTHDPFSRQQPPLYGGKQLLPTHAVHHTPSLAASSQSPFNSMAQGGVHPSVGATTSCVPMSPTWGTHPTGHHHAPSSQPQHGHVLSPPPGLEHQSPHHIPLGFLHVSEQEEPALRAAVPAELRALFERSDSSIYNSHSKEDVSESGRSSSGNWPPKEWQSFFDYIMRSSVENSAKSGISGSASSDVDHQFYENDKAGNAAAVLQDVGRCCTHHADIREGDDAHVVYKEEDNDEDGEVDAARHGRGAAPEGQPVTPEEGEIEDNGWGGMIRQLEGVHSGQQKGLQLLLKKEFSSFANTACAAVVDGTGPRPAPSSLPLGDPCGADIQYVNDRYAFLPLKPEGSPCWVAPMTTAAARWKEGEKELPCLSPPSSYFPVNQPCDGERQPFTTPDFSAKLVGAEEAWAPYSSSNQEDTEEEVPSPCFPPQQEEEGKDVRLLSSPVQQSKIAETLVRSPCSSSARHAENAEIQVQSPSSLLAQEEAAQIPSSSAQHPGIAENLLRSLYIPTQHEELNEQEGWEEVDVQSQHSGRIAPASFLSSDDEAQQEEVSRVNVENGAQAMYPLRTPFNIAEWGRPDTIESIAETSQTTASNTVSRGLLRTTVFSDDFSINPRATSSSSGVDPPVDVSGGSDIELR